MTPNTPSADDISCDKTPNTDNTSPRLFECNLITVEIDDDTHENSEELLKLLEDNGESLSTDDARNVSDSWESIKFKARTQHPLLLKAVSSILFESDPACLNFDTNDDEYDCEAITIISKLGEAKGTEDVAEIIIVTFFNWLDCDLSPYKDNDKFIRMSQRIWLAWCEHKNQPIP